MAKYTRDHFQYLGLTAPERRKMQRAGLEEVVRDSTTQPLLSLDVCDCLWERKEREAQLCRMDLLDRGAPYWAAADPQVTLPRLERFFRHKAWWDTIDFLSSHAVLSVFHAHPSSGAVEDAARRWCIDEHMWTRRVSILWQLRRKNETDADLLFHCIRVNMADKDFFIRKAIGWALREYRKCAPDAVDAFINANAAALSPLSVREAWKHR